MSRQVYPPMTSRHAGWAPISPRACPSKVRTGSVLNQPRRHKIEISLQLMPATRDLWTTWHPVAAFRVIAGKTAAHRGHIDPQPGFLLRQPESHEPTEQGPAGSPSERPSGLDLPRSRCLTDQHYRRQYRLSRDRRSGHARAIAATAQGSLMVAKGVWSTDQLGSLSVMLLLCILNKKECHLDLSVYRPA